MIPLRLRLLMRLRPVLRFIKFRILHIDDSPQRIARGIAMGLFTAYLPLIGLHMLIAFILAKIVRANKAMAVMWVWVCNPLTFVIIYYPCYRIGRPISAIFHHKSEIDIKQLEVMLHEHLSFWMMIVNIFSYDYWKDVMAVFTQIGLDILLGGIVLGGIVAGLGYWIAYNAIIGYRYRKLSRKSLFPTRQAEEKR